MKMSELKYENFGNVHDIDMNFSAVLNMNVHEHWECSVHD